MKKSIVLIIVIILFAEMVNADDQWTSFLTNNSETDYINAIVTEGNILWAATSGGIVKWDMAKGTYSIVKTGFFFSAAIDWNGVKWFGSSGSIYAYNDTTWAVINEGDGQVRSIVVDSFNKRIVFAIYKNLSITNGNYTLISYDGEKWGELINFDQTTFFPDLPMAVDTVNPWNIWAGGFNSTIYLFSKGAQGYNLFRIGLNIQAPVIKSIAIDSDNRLWLTIGGSKINIYLFDRNTLTAVPFGPEITGAIGLAGNVVIDQNGVKWFGSDGALVRYDNTRWSAYPFFKKEEFDAVTVILVDENRNVWMGRGGIHGGYGLWRLHPTITAVNEDAVLPKTIKITGNSPNPFNPSTTISFSVSAQGKTEFAVYSATGQRVRTLISGDQTAGTHSVVWNGRDDNGKPVSSGVYISRLQMGNKVAVGRMLLLK